MLKIPNKLAGENGVPVHHNPFLVFLSTLPFSKPSVSKVIFFLFKEQRNTRFFFSIACPFLTLYLC